jgi:hypothetical protein
MTAWDYVQPAQLIPASPLGHAREVPARYHRRDAYHTNEPDTLLWQQVRAAIKDACPPSLFKIGSGWCLEYIVITSEALAQRVGDLLIKYRPEDACLRFHLMRSTGLTLSQPLELR